jgi:hypothetical protein
MFLGTRLAGKLTVIQGIVVGLLRLVEGVNGAGPGQDIAVHLLKGKVGRVPGGEGAVVLADGISEAFVDGGGPGLEAVGDGSRPHRGGGVLLLLLLLQTLGRHGHFVVVHSEDGR